VTAKFHGVESAEASIALEAVFTTEEIRQIRAYYDLRTKGNGKGKGKSKHENRPRGLPPGIANNLARGKSLPPGIKKQVLPYELRQVLPPVRDGHERIIVAGKVLLVEVASQIVRDVLTDVILN